MLVLFISDVLFLLFISDVCLRQYLLCIHWITFRLYFPHRGVSFWGGRGNLHQKKRYKLSCPRSGKWVVTAFWLEALGEEPNDLWFLSFSFHPRACVCASTLIKFLQKKKEIALKDVICCYLLQQANRIFVSYFLHVMVGSFTVGTIIWKPPGVTISCSFIKVPCLVNFLMASDMLAWHQIYVPCHIQTSEVIYFRYIGMHDKKAPPVKKLKSWSSWKSMPNMHLLIMQFGVTGRKNYLLSHPEPVWCSG